MAFTKLEDYKNKRARYSYPSDKINPGLKENKEYYLAFCNAMIADHTSNNYQIPFEFGSTRSFQELRLYVQGKQPNSKYKDILIGPNRKNEEGKHITKMNISWDIYDVMGEKFDKLRAKNQKVEMEVDARCIDTESLQTKEADREMMKFIIHPATQAFAKATGYRPASGLDPSALQVETEEDVDLYHDTGAYTTQREIACVAACQKTKLVSGYKDIQDKCMDDLITIGIAGWKLYIDKATKEVKMRYVDPAKAVIPFSSYNDFRFGNKGAEIREITISELRQENPDLTADQLLYIAKCYSYMNPEYGQMLASRQYQTDYTNSYMSDYNIDPINRCVVLVLDAQWLSSDTITKVRNIRPGGKSFSKEVDYGYVLDERAIKDGDKIVQKNVIRKYYATWVIGTEILLSCGKCEDVVYYGENGNKTPRIDFFFAKTGNKSIAERCISIIDDIQLAKLRLRNALASMPPPPGIIIQEHLLENVFLNDKLQEPEDLLHTLMEKGILVVNSLDDSGKPVFQNQKPIEYIPQGIIEQLTIFRNEIQAGLQELDIVIGNAGSPEASVQNPYAGLGTREMASDAAENGFYPTFNAYKKLFLDGFNDCVKKWQIIAKDNTIKLNYSPLGSRNMKVLELAEDFSNSDFNISMEVGTGDQQRRDIIEYIISLRDVGLKTDGQEGLTSAEFLYVYDRIMGGNLKEAMFVLAQIEKKKQIANSKAKQAAEERTFQGQQQSTMVANQQARLTSQTTEAEKRKTSIVTEAMKRKTAATNQFLKSKDAEGAIPLTEGEYKQIIADADQEVASIIASDVQQQQQQTQQPQQCGQQVAA